MLFYSNRLKGFISDYNIYFVEYINSEVCLLAWIVECFCCILPTFSLDRTGVQCTKVVASHGSHRLSSNQYSRIALSRFLTENQKLGFLVALNVVINGTSQWGLHRSNLLFPSEKCCRVLFSDGEGTGASFCYQEISPSRLLLIGQFTDQWKDLSFPFFLWNCQLLCQLSFRNIISTTCVTVY